MSDVADLLSELKRHGSIHTSDMVDELPNDIQAAIDRGLVKEVTTSGMFDATRAFALTQAGRFESGLDSRDEPVWRRWLRRTLIR